MGRQGFYTPLLTLFDSEKTHQIRDRKGAGNTNGAWLWVSGLSLQDDCHRFDSERLHHLHAGIVQLVETAGLDPARWEFESLYPYQITDAEFRIKYQQERNSAHMESAAEVVGNRS